MIDTTKYFVAWGIIVFIMSVFALVTYLWLSRVARFENRKKEIAVGVITCVLALAALMFLPMLFSRIDLHKVGEEIFEAIQSSELAKENVGEKLNVAPFIKPFSHAMSLIPLKHIRLIMIGIPAVVSVIVIIFVMIILFKIREPKKTTKKEYSRRHLFEYNSEIVTNLNKKK